MSRKCCGRWASRIWIHHRPRRTGHASCSDQTQKTPPWFLGFTGLHGKHALAISQRVEKLQQVVNDDKALLQSLTDQAANSKAAAAETSGDGLEVAKAQLALDSDFLAHAHQDLARRRRG